MPDLQPRHNPDKSRYEAVLDAGIALAEYQRRGEALAFVHTEVPPAHQDEGVATALVRFALDDVRDRGLKVLPLCPFVAAFVREHPAYQDLVPDAFRDQG